MLGAYAFTGSLVSFLGWPLDMPRLTDWFRAGVSMQPNTCVLAMLSGAGIMLVQWRAWRAVAALGALVALGGALVLAQHIIGADFGFNHQLLFGRTWGREATVTPGRMGPPASAAFTLIGTALVLLALSRLRQRLAAWDRFVPGLAMAVCVISVFSLFGYLFGAEEFYVIPWLTAIALPTSTILMAVGAGLMLSVPERDPVLLLFEDSGAGTIARIAIPALGILIPLALLLRIWAYEAGWFDLGTGRALGALTILAVAMVILWNALMTLRRREQALRDADRRKDEFLATLAHELRNPLTPVMNSLWILDHAGDQAIAADARAIIWRQMQHMVRLIDDLLDVARISRGAFELRKEPVELQAVVRQAAESFGPVCEAAQQQLGVDLPAEPVWIEADPVRLAQVLGNLLSNACRYSDAGSEIAVRAYREGGDVVISVSDSGIGIPADRLEDIFGMFNQIDRSLTRTAGGLGIGLYLVRRLVMMHGGTVAAHSEGAGRGSEIIVRLPVAAGPRPDAGSPPAVNRAMAAPSPGRRILVVDDNGDAARTMALLLGGHGYVTETVYDGQQAVEAAGRLRPDVILLDIGLPGLSGYEAARQIRLQPWGRTIAIIAVTGWGQAEDRRRTLQGGFDAHLVKPVDPSVLFELLPALLRKREQPRRGAEAADPV